MLSAIAAGLRRRRFGAVAFMLYTALAVAVMAPLAPLLVPSTPAQDLCNHISGLIEARRALEEGQFPIRIAPDQNLQTRYPIFQFYGNLPYTLGGAVYLATHFDPYKIWKLEVITFLVLGAFFTYRCGRVLTRQPLPALAAGAVFMTAPYVLTDIHGRFAFSEILAFMLLPAVFYWSWRSFCARGIGPILGCGVSWSALALSHNIGYLYAATFFGLFFVSWLAPRRKQFVRCLRVGAGFALGMVLTAWTIVPQQMLVSELRDGLLMRIFANAWLTPLGVLLSPGVSLPVHVPTIYIDAPEHFGLQVGWPILVAVGLSLCYLRSPLVRLHGRQALLVRLLLLFALTFVMTWSPFDFWSHLPTLFNFVQFSYRLLMFVVLFGSLLAAYALALAFQQGMRPMHLAIVVLGLGWSTGPYLRPHKWDPGVNLANEIANPEMGRGGANGCYLLAGKSLAQTTLVHKDMNWADPNCGGIIDGMELHNRGRHQAIMPSLQPGDALLLKGIVSDEVECVLPFIISVDGKPAGYLELPPGPFDVEVPLPAVPDKARVLVTIDGKPLITPPPELHRAPFLRSSYRLSHMYLKPGSTSQAGPRLMLATETRPQVQFGHPTRLHVKTAEPVLVQMPILYYPGMQRAKIDGHLVRVQNLGCFVAVEVPWGDHAVSVKFVGVPWADRVSLAAWIAVGVGAFAVGVKRLRRGLRRSKGGKSERYSLVEKRLAIGGGDARRRGEVVAKGNEVVQVL